LAGNLGERPCETSGKETGYEGVKWIHVAHDRVQSRTFVKMVKNLRIPLKMENLSSN
jgi:hypothetical protein